ncbi:putative membrane protein [Staphylococcus phage Stab22]|nr:putative membrane protein [Staphylococcus phage Stab22]VEV89538.1 putative membrane protein [Staphylococcus phage Stab22]
MNKVLEFIMYYLIYLVAGFIGVCVGNLITGGDINPLTFWMPYVFALAFALLDV